MPFLAQLKRFLFTGSRSKLLDLIFKTIIANNFTRLTRGQIHATDYSNICVSGLWDPYTFQWIDWLINMLNIPKSMLPEIRDTCGDWGSIHSSIFGAEIPIRCVVRIERSD